MGKSFFFFNAFSLPASTIFAEAVSTGPSAMWPVGCLVCGWTGPIPGTLPASAQVDKARTSGHHQAHPWMWLPLTLLTGTLWGIIPSILRTRKWRLKEFQTGPQSEDWQMTEPASQPSECVPFHCDLTILACGTTSESNLLVRGQKLLPWNGHPGRLVRIFKIVVSEWAATVF